MPLQEFDRRKLVLKPLRERPNKVVIERDLVAPNHKPRALSTAGEAVVAETAQRLVLAKEKGAARILAFGAHAIKNGLAPVLIELINQGWLTHLATNGAGIIHDWEFAFQGASSEDVRANVAQGLFGAWEETGRYINLAIAVGAYKGWGYGESVGALVENEQLDIPQPEDLRAQICDAADGGPARAAAAADLLELIQAFHIAPGAMRIPHPYKQFGLQAVAYRLNLPFTGHPMIGHDIIYIHPMNRCAAIGRTAQRDFLSFVHSVANLEHGVYLSVGSAVMSPMIFEKSLSMAQNAAIQQHKPIQNHFIVVVDLQPSTWDWSKGEPPQDNPDYYLRYCKTFARMGGVMRYVEADNRDFLLALLHILER